MSLFADLGAATKPEREKEIPGVTAGVWSVHESNSGPANSYEVRGYGGRLVCVCLNRADADFISSAKTYRDCCKNETTGEAPF